MNLPGISIKRPVSVIMTILVIVMIGTVSLSKLEMDLLPDLNMPIAVATARYEGAGPKEIESLVARPFEAVLSTVSNLESIETLSYDEYCLAILHFTSSTNMDFATLEMREKLDLAETMLPQGVDDILVMRIDPNNFNATMEIGVSSAMEHSDLTRLLNDQILNKLERLDGVASVSLTGGTEQEMQILLNEDQLRLYGLNASYISRMLGAENLDLPAGQMESSGKNIYLKTKGEFSSIKDIGAMLLTMPTGGHVFLRDIAEIRLAEKEQSSLSFIDGKLALTLAVQKQSNANTVMVSRAVREQIERMESLHPNVHFFIIYDGSRYISQAIRTVTDAALQGGLLAILILYLFLRNIRATLIIGLSIPVSIVSTFVLMYFAGIQINLLSLGGLALGIGMLVDNAIVVLENIYRYRWDGMNKKEAAEKGAKEVMLAISASTLTSVVVFIPIVFIEGVTGRVFKEMALTITFSLLSSLIIAITFVPMVASHILNLEYKVHERGKVNVWTRALDAWERFYQSVLTRYRSQLRRCLAKKNATLGVAIILMFLSLSSAFLIGYEYFPSMDEGYVSIHVSLPRGSSLSETHEVAMAVQSRLHQVPEVKSIVMSIGEGGAILDRSTVENAAITAGIGKIGDRKRPLREITDDIRKNLRHIPGAVIQLSNSGNIMGISLGTSVVEIRLFGEDMDRLRFMAGDLKERLAEVDGIRDIESSVEDLTEEAVIHIDRSKAALYQLTTAQVADSVLSSLNGSIATQYQYRGSQIDVRVSSSQYKANSLEALKSVALSSPLGVSIPLSEIAEIKMEKTPATILRYDQKRCVTLTAGTNGKALNQITRDIEKALECYDFPKGYTYGFGGQQEELYKSFDDLFMALILAACIVYMLLAAQFESFIYPFTIMMSVPLSLTGGLLALFLTGKTLSIPSFIGIIILVGIVVNNAIVLVDTINRFRQNGMSREEAIFEAGPQRLRPILMTTLTTVLGMVPMALGAGEGSEIQSPLAVVVIGGLSLSTFVTLLVIPSLYAWLDDLQMALRNKHRRFNRSDHPVSPQ